MLVQGKRRGLGLVQYFQFIAQNLNRPRCHIRVYSASRTGPHFTRDLHDILTAHSVGQGKGLLPIRVENYLSQTLSITNIQKYYTTMIAAAVNPAAKGNFLIRQRFVQLAAIVGTHHVVVFLS